MVSIQNTLFRLAFIDIYEINVFSPESAHWTTMTDMSRQNMQMLWI